MPTVAVIGAGFSGLLTAIHVLRSDSCVRVRLFERSSQFGRGRAYSTANPHHLLNVRAENMSAFPNQPDHFKAWLREKGLDGSDGDFVSRGRYGDYLQDELTDALTQSGLGRLNLEVAQVVSLVPAKDGRWTLESAKGDLFVADAVVLAVGLLAPKAIPGATQKLLGARSIYFNDPWTVDLAGAPEGEVLVVGSGLTMIDVALSLTRQGRRVIAISRRGLLPRSHAPTGSHATSLPLAALSSPLRALVALRWQARKTGWRETVDGVRPLTGQVWRAWPLDQKKRFLRHLRPWWDVHRHRMAPPIAEEVDRLISEGELTVIAGAILDLDIESDGAARLRYRARGGSGLCERSFGAVVNCTGPDADLSRSHLLAGLLAQNVVRGDLLRLGLDVDDVCRPIGAGGIWPGLFVVGPLTRGAFWETVAVPDLRNQANEVAHHILRFLGAARSARGAA